MSVRTFDLVPVISSLTNDNTHAKIECMSQAGGQLWIGLSDGWIHRYNVDVGSSASGQSLYHCKLHSSKRISTKKPIMNLMVVEGLNRLVYLCDNLLAMLDAATVEIVPGGSSKIKSVSAFSLNDRIDPENPFISYEMCVVKKKTIQIVVLTENQLSPVIEISLHETPLKTVFSDPFVCFASTSQYHVVNVKETSHQIHDLFPYPDVPVIASLTDSEVHEFLLSGPGGLGMFVSGTTLVSPRPPINWAELRVTNMQYSSPYILVYSQEDIWVYSAINQQPKQSLQFDVARAMCSANSESGHATPLMASSTQVWALVHVPWKEQVDALLADKRVDEALEIGRSYREEDTDDHFRHLLERSALIQLHRRELQAAKELLLESQCSPGFILSYCHDLCPQNDISTPAASPFPIDFLTSDKPAIVKKRNRFLVDYLEEYRRLSLEWTPELNLVLLRLFIDTQQNDAILPFIKSYRNIQTYDECKKILAANGRFVALVFFQVRMGYVTDAVSLLKDLLDAVTVDTVHGSLVNLGTLADILKSTEDRGLALQTLPWLLKNDPSLGLEVLKSIAFDSDDADSVGRVLDDFPAVRLEFLEFLIFHRENKNAGVYKELAGLYLSHLHELHRSSSDAVRDAREIRTKLQAVLQSELLTDVSSEMINLIDKMQLHQEKVLLLAKAGEHFVALDLLAHELKDRAGAVDYCVQYGRDDKGLKRQMFEHLLAIYFNPKEQNEESVRAALELLNDEAADFDVSKVLSILPANWPVECLEDFLSHTLRRSLHAQRTGAIERSLSKCLFFSAQLATVGTWKQKIVLSEERRCVFCKKQFSESRFKCLVDGRLAHISCGQSTQ